MKLFISCDYHMRLRFKIKHQTKILQKKQIYIFFIIHIKEDMIFFDLIKIKNKCTGYLFFSECKKKKKNILFYFVNDGKNIK